MVQNFGQVASKTAGIKLFFTKGGKDVEVATGKIASLKPYGMTTVDLNCGQLFDAGVEYIFKVVVNPDDQQPVVLHGKLIPVKQ